MTNTKAEVITFKGKTPIGRAYFIVNWKDDDGAEFISPKAKLLDLLPPGITELEQLDYTPEVARKVVAEKPEDVDWEVALAYDTKELIDVYLNDVLNRIPLDTLVKVREAVEKASGPEEAIAALKDVVRDLKAKDKGLKDKVGPEMFDQIDWSKVSKV